MPESKQNLLSVAAMTITLSHRVRAQYDEYVITATEEGPVAPVIQGQMVLRVKDGQAVVHQAHADDNLTGFILAEAVMNLARKIGLPEITVSPIYQTYFDGAARQDSRVYPYSEAVLDEPVRMPWERKRNRERGADREQDDTSLSF